MTILKNPYDLKKEVILKLAQKIGEVDFEIEHDKGTNRVELSLTEDKVYMGSLTFEPYELDSLAKFFERCHIEVKKINTEGAS